MVSRFVAREIHQRSNRNSLFPPPTEIIPPTAPVAGRIFNHAMQPSGGNFKDKIDENLERADIILMLVSADFIASDYCYEKELFGGRLGRVLCGFGAPDGRHNISGGLL